MDRDDVQTQLVARGMAKKRKEPVQSSTLHDFFTSSSAKKPKCRSTTPKAAKRVVTEDITPDDIIVISDDDEPEGVENHTRTVGTYSLNVPADVSEMNAPTLDTFIMKAEEKETMQEVWSDLDPPLDDPSLDDLILGKSPSSFKPRCVSDTPRHEDWEMGDDEDVFSQLEDEEEDQDIEMTEDKVQLCGGEYPVVEHACPVCEQSLKGLFQTQVDRHVNSCIDGLSASPIAIGAEIKEPLSPRQQQLCPPSTSASVKSTSAFSVLMSSHKENIAWKEASEAENKKGNMRGRRPAPFYKVMQGMPIAVDAFRYGKIPDVTAYFLTHAHSDHYTNLSSSWKNGPIYCSQTTSNLIIHMLKVDSKWVHPLPMNTPTVIPDTGGVEVTLIQANHCPGSVLFLFKGMQTVNAGDSTFQSPFVGSQRVFRYLHCGDFRACPQHVLHSEIKGKKMDVVHLDTTYLDPKYCFPPQPLVISACAELARRIVQENDVHRTTSPDGEPTGKSVMTGWLTISEKGKEKRNYVARDDRVLVVVGTYTIGKERIVKAIAKALSTKIYCDARKTAVLRCLSDPELHAMLTSDPFEAGVHIVPLHTISSDTFKDYLSKWKGHWKRAVGFRPTGWTYTAPSGMDTSPSISNVITRDQARSFTYANLRPMRNSNSTLMLYGVPYSEHSSFFELTCFALSLDWGKMIATVNVGSQNSRMKMAKWFEKWQVERNKRERVSGNEIVEYRQLDYW